MEGPLPRLPRDLGLKDAPWRIFGIRHHGPGSARSLVAAFDAWRPDCVLVEGPPDADALIPLAAREGMEPPVALLVHDEDAPLRSSFWPFARFSPEWQAILWALREGVPVRFMDLPFSHRPHDEEDATSPKDGDAPTDSVSHDGDEDSTESVEGREGESGLEPEVIADPLGELARAAGEGDGEAWWNRVVEERGGPDVFEAVLEAMRELRRGLGRPSDRVEAQREAWMRQTLREATKAGHRRIAAVCGAWHGPALEDLPPAREDQALLKGLRRRKTRASWVPWTHDRLARASGYGAGVTSPGWYDHLWTGGPDADVRWMVGAASALRERGHDASSASVIESVRLATTLAALRGRARPGRIDFDEAMLSVLCNGDTVLHGMVRRGIEVGIRQGSLCPDAPRTPLQADLESCQKRLRLPAEAVEKELDLDLRKDIDRDRSILLRRLRILGVPWGVPESRRERGGTFHERWKLQWRPEFAVSLVDASRLGGTVAEAARVRLERPEGTPALPELVDLLREGILADLPQAVEALCLAVRAAAARSDDTLVLLEACAPLATLARFGDVRETDRGLVAPVARELLVRACLSLPAACRALDDDGAPVLVRALEAVHATTSGIDDRPDDPLPWKATLLLLARDGAAHGLAAGRAARLLLDGGDLDTTEAETLLGLSLSPGTDPAPGARWIEGFLRDGARLLLHDDRLRALVSDWFSGLSEPRFQESLPLLRRAFAGSAPGDRSRLLSRLAPGAATRIAKDVRFHEERAASILPALLSLLGRTP